MDQKQTFLNALRRVAELCAVSAMTAPKSGGQLFLKGSKPFIETVIVEDRDTLRRLAASSRSETARTDVVSRCQHRGKA